MAELGGDGIDRRCRRRLARWTVIATTVLAALWLAAQWLFVVILYNRAPVAAAIAVWTIVLVEAALAVGCLLIAAVKPNARSTALSAVPGVVWSLAVINQTIMCATIHVY